LVPVAALGQNGGVLPSILMLVALFVVIPVGVMMTGAVVAWLLGFSLKTDVEKDYEGTEYIELTK
jgi:hypothetical protein